jgi:hypothetical protein
MKLQEIIFQLFGRKTKMKILFTQLNQEKTEYTYIAKIDKKLKDSVLIFPH